MIKLIGISGKKKSGKSTLAEYLIQAIVATNKKTLSTVHVISFADSLKEEVAEACGVSVMYLNEYKDNFRLILQGWGTDFRRKLMGDNYWISKVRTKIQALPKDSVVIIPDVRFVNEAHFVSNNGGFLIRVNRKNLPKDNHPSETTLDDYTGFNSYNDNDSSLEDLKGYAKHFVEIRI